MFPQISKKRKKEYVVDEPILKQLSEALREVQQRSKISLKHIPNYILHDFSKVCRVKAIPEFYANYFICSLAKAQQSQLSQAFTHEMQLLLTNNSHFHRINQALRQREELIEGLRNSLLIVEGFLLMNQNKVVPLHAKSLIDEFVNDCATLEELKGCERKKTEELAKDIIRVRTNTVLLIGLVSDWRESLEANANDQRRKVKAVYPHQAINCLLMPLYDVLFMRNSFLKSEISFGKDEKDPFLSKISKAKKGSQIQNYFIDYLQADTTDYGPYLKYILDELPNLNGEQLKAKELQLQLRKEQKEKQQKLKEQKLKLLREEKEKNVRIKRYSSLRGFRPTQPEETQGLRNANSRTSKGPRSQKKIINIDRLLHSRREKADKQNNQAGTKLEAEGKVIKAYQKMKKSPMQESMVSEKEGKDDKRFWEKQIKEEKEEKQKIRKLLKQTEKKAIQEAKMFDQKLKRYEDEVANLKTKIQTKKYVSRPVSSSEKEKIKPTLSKVKKINEIYGNQGKPKQPSEMVLQSRLQQQSKIRKNLQKQIKQLISQKSKMEKLVESSTIKASRENEVTQKKIEKYEEVINRLKNESENSKAVIQEIESSKVALEKKTNSVAKAYAIKEKQEQLKRNILAKMRQREKRKQMQDSKVSQMKKSRIQASRVKEKLNGDSVVLSNSSNSQIKPQTMKIEELEAKLHEQSFRKRNLEKQFIQLNKEKIRLEKFIEVEGKKSNKQSSNLYKKLEQYQSAIQKLKDESQVSKSIISQYESSKVIEQKKAITSRAASVSKKQDDLRKKIEEQIKLKEKESSSRKKSKQEKSISKLNETLEREKKQKEEVEIIKTKQTIEIVFEPRKQKSQPAHPSSELVETESKLIRLEKEKQLLQKKLELSMQRKQKVDERNKKSEERDYIAQKIRKEVEKQRQKNIKLQQNLKRIRKNISKEYQLKLNKQKVRYQRQKQELLSVIEHQREEKKTKDRILQQQMGFLKQMQQKEEELIDLLAREKQQKMKKEQSLAKQLQEKQELMRIIELQEIKKGIERDVRMEIQENEPSEDDDISYQQRKAYLEQEIEVLKMQKESELDEMNQQNDKLKELITRLKQEENTLLVAMKDNIEIDSDIADNEEENELEGDQENIAQLDVTSNKIGNKHQEFRLEELQAKNEALSKELVEKTAFQLKNEEKKKGQYSKIVGSQQYQEKQKIQNLVQFYLQSPHKYPGDSKPKITQKEKKEIVQSSAENASLIQKFQSQLFSLKELPDFVPSLKNDSINNHLLILRDQYENYEADALRRELFPPLEKQVYGEGDLSYEEPEPPMNTIMDHVQAHQRKYPLRKQEKGKKNFLAINRVRLAVLEDHKKLKQRMFIEQESRKKIQRQLFNKRRKQREQNFQRIKEKEQQKREQFLSKQKRRADRVKEKQKAKDRQRRQKSKQRLKSDSGSEASIIDKYQKKRRKNTSNSKRSDSSIEKPSKQKEVNKKQERNSSQSQTQSDLQLQIKEKKEETTPQKEIEPIKQEHSIEQQEAEIQQRVNEYEAQLQKRERNLLKDEVKQVQDEVRAFISQQQHYEIYQQFVNEGELLYRIQEILDLSSGEVKALNANSTIKQDIQLYSSVALLVAKNSKGLQIGVGIFHKEFQRQQYVCDYILAHSMDHFLNLTFNFSRFLFGNDEYLQRAQFIFDTKPIENPSTLRNFIEFENKCKRLGEVYAKAKSETQRKYILRRSLFQAKENGLKNAVIGTQFKLSLSICDSILRQIGEGFANMSNANFSSFNVILAYYLSQHPNTLLKFKEKAQSQLFYRELLVTALLFQKKELEIKSIESILLEENNYSPLEHLTDSFQLKEVSEIQQMKLNLSDKLPQSAKRCILEVGYQQINYMLLMPEEAITTVQSSNSSQTGYFLSLIPKHKLMIIEAEEFLTMSGKNPDLTAFFYIKHFIKNIVDIKKETYERVYLPQIHLSHEFYYKQLSRKLGKSVFLKENLDLGWKGGFPNSVLFTPRHKDLVVQKPYLIALLAGGVERAVEGSPIIVELIT